MMIRSRGRAMLPVMVALSIASMSSAQGALIWHSQDRMVNSYASSPIPWMPGGLEENQALYQAQGFDRFDGVAEVTDPNTVRATQSSWLTSTGFRCIGTVDRVNVIRGTAAGVTRFDVTFAIDSITQIRLSGLSSATTQLFLMQGSAVLIAGGGGQLDRTLTLGPGEYRFYLYTTGGVDNGRIYTGSTDITAEIVPTAPSLALLGLGMLAIARRRR